jgi:hypothetical protein
MSHWCDTHGSHNSDYGCEDCQEEQRVILEVQGRLLDEAAEARRAQRELIDEIAEASRARAEAVQKFADAIYNPGQHYCPSCKARGLLRDAEYCLICGKNPGTHYWDEITEKDEKERVAKEKARERDERVRRAKEDEAARAKAEAEADAQTARILTILVIGAVVIVVLLIESLRPKVHAPTRTETIEEERLRKWREGFPMPNVAQPRSTAQPNRAELDTKEVASSSEESSVPTPLPADPPTVRCILSTGVEILISGPECHERSGNIYTGHPLIR